MIGKIIRKIKIVQKRRNLNRMFSRMPKHAGTNAEHGASAMAWLSYAQDISGTGGIPAGYFLLDERWGNEYRETTGYSIVTFLNYARYANDASFRDRAIAMGNWELSVQCDDGSFGEILPDGSIGKKIFNTGQVIFGMCALYDETKDASWLAGARRAADWIVAMQEGDGSWEKYTTQGSRTYHTRDAWALLEAWKRTGIEEYKTAAIRQLDWSLSMQESTGWYKETSLSDPDKPWTHLIGYTVSGFVESALLLGGEGMKYLTSAKKSLDAMRHAQRLKNGLLPTTFDKNWQSHDTDSCLTGDAQIAFYWMKVGLLCNDIQLQEAAREMAEAVKRTHILSHADPRLSGAIAGSYPIGGAYCSYTLINWGVKFFIDLLLLIETRDTTLTS